MHADTDDDLGAAAAVAEEVRTTALGRAPSPLTAIEGADPLLDMDGSEPGTPLGDLEAVSPR